MTAAMGAGGLALAFANRQFRMYTIGSLLSLLGTWIQRVAIGWLAWEMTGRHAWVGAVAMADMLPVVFIAPLAGAFADRLDRLRVARILQYGNMAVATVLATLSVSGLLSIGVVFALALAQGAVNATFQPFRQSLIANMVSREELPGAIAINSTAWHGSRFVGPAIAGGVIALWGTSAAFLINALSYITFIYVLYRLRVAAPPRIPRALADLPREILEGVRYAFRHPVIAPVLFILFVSSCVGRAVLELLPGMADEIFGHGEAGFAALVSAAGLGAMLGALWFGWRAHRANLVRLAVANVLLLAIGLVGLVATGMLGLGLASLVVTGFGLLGSGIAIQTIVQGAVEERLRGRVLGIFGWFWVGVPGLGAMLIGELSDLTGPRAPVLAGAALVLLAWIWGIRRQRSIALALSAA